MQRTALLAWIGVVGCISCQGALSASVHSSDETRSAAHPLGKMRLAQSAVAPPPGAASAEPAPIDSRQRDSLGSRVHAATEGLQSASSQAASRVHAAATIAGVESASSQATSRDHAAAASAGIEPASSQAASRAQAAAAGIEPASSQAASRVHAAAVTTGIEPAYSQAASRVHAAAMTGGIEPAALQATSPSSMAKSAILKEKIQAVAKRKGGSRQ